MSMIQIETPAADISATPPLPERATFRSRIARRLEQGIYSGSRRYGLRRDLTVPLETPKAKIPIEIRPLQLEDLEILLPIACAEHAEIAARRRLVALLPTGCHVAVDLRTNTPCYMQWLVGHKDNPRIRKVGGFPDMKPDEALLEGAYTPPAHRGLRIMSEAMALIAEKAHDLGARYVLTFVAEDNIASLKGCQRSGFNPHLMHSYRQFGYELYRQNRFAVLPDSDPRRTANF